MRRSGRSLLRQTSVLLLLFCLGASFAAPALAQGPAPEPGPPRSQTPRPEPAPGATPQPSRPATTQAPPPPAAPASAPSQVLSTPSTPAQVQPPAAAQPERRQVRKRETATKKPVRERTTKQTVRKALPSLVRNEAGSPDTPLLIGGLALFVLVLCDTVFLTLSTRVLRSAG